MLLDTFIKTYGDRIYTHVTSLRHKGSLIALAMDATRRIFYSVLDMNGEADLGPLDVNYWSETPSELIFPAEITQAGIGVADQARMLTYKKGSKTAAPADSSVRDDELDVFNSTTARLTANAPFQALSDGRYVYIFRQAVAAGDQNNVAIDAKGQLVDDKAREKATFDSWLVSSTLLVDRFVLAGTQLQPKMEVRYQRSRSRSRPYSRKDSLGAKDMQDAPFFEPTQELGFVGNLEAGRFAALLLPTQVAGVMRWQIFTYNTVSRMVDSYNVERSEDGLFNTRGTQATTYSGSAELALYLANGRHLRLNNELKLPAAFSIETWISLDKSSSGAGSDGQTLVGSDSQDDKDAGLRIRLNPSNGDILFGFGDGKKFLPVKASGLIATSSQDNRSWSHLAVSFDGEILWIYVDGMLRCHDDTLAGHTPKGGFDLIGAPTAGFKGVIDEMRVWARARSERQIAADMNQRLTGREPDLLAYWRLDEACGSEVYDQTDNLNHALCCSADSKPDEKGWVPSDAPIGETGSVQRSSFHIVGREVASGMAALFYYHQEESASGYGSSGPLKHTGRVLLTFGAAQVTSGAITGPTANIAAIDLGVSVDGRLAQIPDNLRLELLQEEALDLSKMEAPAPPSSAPVVRGSSSSGNGQGPGVLRAVWRPKRAVEASAGAVAASDPIVPTLGAGPTQQELISAPETLTADDKMSVSRALTYLSDLEQEDETLSSKIDKLDTEIAAYDEAIEIIDAALNDKWARQIITALANIGGHKEECGNYNSKIKRLDDLRQSRARASADVRRLETELANARLIVYEHINFGGRSLALTKGDWSYTYLSEKGFNDLISSYDISSCLTATFHEHSNKLGRSFVGVEKNSWIGSVGNKWNDVVSCIDVTTTSTYDRAYQEARKAIEAALKDVAACEAELRTLRADAAATRQGASDERALQRKDRDAIRVELQRVRSHINNGSSIPMALVHIDPHGLSISGGILEFAWTTDTPLLFDSATGSLALYFRGGDGQFFVCYYKTLTRRATCQLNGDNARPALTCSVRSADPSPDQVTIGVADGTSDDTCTVTITLGEIKETWNCVPRGPDGFARVINGGAVERGFVGLGRPVNTPGGVQRLAITSPRGLRRNLAKDDVLIIGQNGQSRVRVAETTDQGALEVPVTTSEASLPDVELPVFYVEYDYQEDTDPKDLITGSRLLVIQPVSDSPVVNARPTSVGSTVSCQWTASAPGYTLSFGGNKSVVCSAPADSGNFAAPRDLTLEAWVQTGDLGGARTDDNPIRRVITQHSAGSSYSLGLRREPIKSALVFEAERSAATLQPSINIANHAALAFQDAITIEAWVKLEADSDMSLDIFDAYGSEAGGIIFLRIRDGFYQVGIASEDVGNETTQAQVSAGDLAGETWVHLAGTYSSKDLTWRLYRNGIKINSRSECRVQTLGALTGAHIGPISVPGRSSSEPGKNQAKAMIDEVRIWKRARSQAEIRADQYRRLSGNETDLVANWRFEDGTARDYGRSGIAGTMSGFKAGAAYTLAESPLPAFSCFAQVGETTQHAPRPFFGGSWTHLAATYDQSYALAFSGGHVDCGNDTTLDLSQDLTIEVFFRYSGGSGGLISRGMLDDGRGQDVPYALYLDNGRLGFAFENVDHENCAFVSDSILEQDTFHRVAVTREQHIVRTEQKNDKGDVIGINVSRSYTIRMYKGRDPIDMLVDQGEPTSVWYYKGADPGSSDGALVIGKAAIPEVSRVPVSAPPTPPTPPMKVTFASATAHTLAGTISEVRIWGLARDASSVGSDIRGDERGLISWWRFEENEGTIAYDSKSKNHGRMRGAVSWVKSPEPGGSRLILYRDGIAQDSVGKLDGLTKIDCDQFSLGALYSAAGSEHFVGELEEVRVWSVTRTQEQIQDNIFGRLLGEREDLIAYYPFDVEKAGSLTDNGNRANHLTVSAAEYVLSTAPIGTDTPQARSALAGLRTSFNSLISSRPAVAEYGDVQYDDEGELSGVLKRSYAFVENGSWKLITGFKVGSLIAEWVGQVQFDPQLIGYIESAPPMPGENLEADGGYSGNIAVELVSADSSTYTYSSTRDKGFDMSVEAGFGTGANSLTLTGPMVPIGILTLTTLEDTQVSGGFKTSYEHSLGWLEEASTSSSVSTSRVTRKELSGTSSGDRFIPDNTGLALVQSETADVFALRLKHSRALVSFQMRPNPDIPKDWNIISFKLNRYYIKQGTLDGRFGLDPDEDYPDATGYSANRSFFKPIEAYALKNRIRREEEDLRAFFDQYDAESKGRRQADTHFTAGDLAAGRSLEKLPRREKRNLVNTYVWTADGGFFAETQETMDVLQETVGGSYAFTGLAGGSLEVDFAIMKARVKFDLTAMFGGHLNLTVQKTAEAEHSFSLNVNLSGMQVKREPGKVDAYRFMSFYLEPRSDHFDTFFNQVVDPIWLEQSDDPNAQALREVRDDNKGDRKPACWRVMHRVTYVSRVLPDFETAAPASLEKTMRDIDIDSNYELIKLLDPFVGDKTQNYGVFVGAVSEAVAIRAPKLIAHIPQIIDYMVLYYDVSEVSSLAVTSDSAVSNASTVAPLRVYAGPDQIVRCDDPTVLRGSIAEGPDKSDSLYVSWKVIESDSPRAPIFSEPYALASGVSFAKKGHYRLRLSASDGLITSTDDVTIVVYEPPQIRLNKAVKVDSNNSADLGGELDLGVPDGEKASVVIRWRQESGTGDAIFDSPETLKTRVKFTSSGIYNLRLTVSNGRYTTSEDVEVRVAARVSDNLLALYSFAEGKGLCVHNVLDATSQLDLAIADADAASWIISEPRPATPGSNGSTPPPPVRDPLGLLVQRPVRIASTGPASDLSKAIAQRGAFSLEVWIKPQKNDDSGLLRIVSLAGGPTARNLILGQMDGRLYAAIRSESRDPGAADRALVAGSIEPDKLQQVVLTREAAKDGQPAMLRLYLNGVEVGSRHSEGDLSAWDTSYALTIAGETGAPRGAWRGAFHLMAIYSRALSADEVVQNCRFGADTNLPPIVAIDDPGPIDLTEAAVLQGTPLVGKVRDDRPIEAVTTSWTQIAGPTAVEFVDPNALCTSATIRKGGVYLLRLTASDGALSSSSNLRLVANEVARISVDGLRDVILPARGRLSVRIDSSGLGSEPSGWKPTISWRQISPEGQATIGAPTAAETEVSFSEPGVYRFQLQVENGRPGLAASAELDVTVHAVPKVEITAQRLINLPDTLALTSAIHSGRGDKDESKVSVAWSKLSGPGGVNFTDPNAPQTTASFEKSGIYKLRLSVANQRATGTANIEVVANAAPLVDVGQDLHVSLETGAQLEGVAGDDGLPEIPGALTLSWSQVSGPDGKAVVFDNPAAGYTMARFKAAGRYVLRLTAADGAASSSDDLAVLVSEAPKLSATRTLLAGPTGGPICLSAQIEASGLADPTLGKLTASWSLVNGPGKLERDTTGEPSVGGTIRATLTANEAGRNLVRLVVGNGVAETRVDYTVLVDSRVHQGLLALYPFAEGGGATVHQAAGTHSGPPLDLQIADPSAVPPAVRWEQGGGLKLLSPTKITSPENLAINPLTAAIKATKALSVEVWLSADAVQGQENYPGRLVSISRAYDQRNITIQRGSGDKAKGSFFLARVYTSTTATEKDQVILSSAEGTATGRRHLIYTFNEAAQEACLYIDGVKVASAHVSGALSGWFDAYRLCLGNEPTGEQRPWLGTYHLVAIYERALSAEEVMKNFKAGTPQR